MGSHPKLWVFWNPLHLGFHMKLWWKKFGAEMLVLGSTFYYKMTCSEIFGKCLLFGKGLFFAMMGGVIIFYDQSWTFVWS